MECGIHILYFSLAFACCAHSLNARSLKNPHCGIHNVDRDEKGALSLRAACKGKRKIQNVDSTFHSIPFHTHYTLRNKDIREEFKGDSHLEDQKNLGYKRVEI
jgi:hypothetical protein